ncbi:vWA domain-containing protein [Polyangium aurulentum]|uniref:vWA domain-containing protein n=1 Tax=Polyangium aurulentum TaxID=2567896 RepID=UPI0010ADEC7B|nr:von Willebrand factor type A domain-containing protein [Polyangium aurulentum]UQA61667.1 von Willebrand factor type A domain-containing protein [Polyangium aurulentum]
MLRTRSLAALATLVSLASTLAACGASAPEASYAPSTAAEAAAPMEASPGAMQPQYDAVTDSAAAAPPPAQYAQGSTQAAPAAMPPAPPPPPSAGAAMPKKEAARTAPVTATSKPAPIMPTPIAVAPPEPKGTEDYRDYGVNAAVETAKDRLSTFAIDVDTASYSISRRKIMEGSLPPFQAVRAEEYLNYFDYAYEAPKSGPFGVQFAAAPSPFTKGHHIVRVGVQGKRLAESERKPVHLVYLVDTSGSMQSEDKMGLVKKSLKMLTGSLKQGDTVALCTYAGSVREVLPPTGIDKKSRIEAAIDDLTASGSTAMASGIELAYKLAERTLVKGHVNRVIVLSDGDANVGPSSHGEILSMIGGYKNKGITLSTVGFGTGNYKDTMMERLADQGDGNYAYIDSEVQARRVFQEQIGGMLEVIARDVKIQVEFDPKVVKQYRLIGYENRDIADRDFRNDKVDAGEIGNGHSVTAVYDVVLTSTTASPLVVRMRHKQPLAGDKATEAAFPMDPSSIAASFDAAPRNFRFATAVAGFAEVLRQSPHAREWSLGDVARIADAAATSAADQQEFVSLVHRAHKIAGGNPAAPVAR